MKNLFVTDLDGTFVKNSVSVAEDDLKAYHIAKKYGDFSVATGRSITEIKYVEDQNNLDVTHMIGFNGAIITQKDKVLFEKHIPENVVGEIFEYLKNAKLIFDALDGNQRIGNFQHEKVERLWNMELICKEDPFPYLKGKTIYKINVRPKAEDLERFYTDMKEKFPEVEIFKSGSTRMEITAKNISKASGIETIKSGYNRVIALGDSGNDVDMFESADISYCMDRAPEDVKDKATHVVEDFAAAIAHFEKNYK